MSFTKIAFASFGNKTTLFIFCPDLVAVLDKVVVLDTTLVVVAVVQPLEDTLAHRHKPRALA